MAKIGSIRFVMEQQTPRRAAETNEKEPRPFPRGTQQSLKKDGAPKTGGVRNSKGASLVDSVPMAHPPVEHSGKARN